MTLLDMSNVSEYFSGMYPVDMKDIMEMPDEDGKTTWWYTFVSLIMAGGLFFTMLLVYVVFFSLKACCKLLDRKTKHTPTIAIDQFRDERSNGFALSSEVGAESTYNASQSNYKQLGGTLEQPGRHSNTPIVF